MNDASFSNSNMFIELLEPASKFVDVNLSPQDKVTSLHKTIYQSDQINVFIHAIAMIVKDYINMHMI